MASKMILGGYFLVLYLSSVYSWMEFPYGNNNFNYHVPYLENVTIECDQRPDNFVFEYWIRPDLTTMKANDYEEFWTLDGISAWQISSDGLQLLATVINSRQFGFYYCVGKVGGQTSVIKKAINYDGPHFGNLWPKYRMNVIIGLSAMAVFLALILIFALTVTYCKCCQSEYKAPEVHIMKKSKKRMSQDGTMSNGAATNSYENIGMRHRGHSDPASPDDKSEDEFIEIRL